MRHRSSLLLVALLSGCSSGAKHPVSEVTARADAAGVQHVRIVAHTYWYEPNRIVVKLNQPVELTVQNGSFMVPHGLSCSRSEAGIAVHGQMSMFHGHRTFRFTPTQTGTFGFECPVGSHAMHGMTGEIVVVP